MMSRLKGSLEKILQSCSDALLPAEMGYKKVEINSTDCDGDTPLHVMVRRADIAGVQVLIESGDNLNTNGIL